METTSGKVAQSMKVNVLSIGKIIHKRSSKKTPAVALVSQYTPHPLLDERKCHADFVYTWVSHRRSCSAIGILRSVIRQECPKEIVQEEQACTIRMPDAFRPDVLRRHPLFAHIVLLLWDEGGYPKHFICIWKPRKGIELLMFCVPPVSKITPRRFSTKTRKIRIEPHCT